MKIVETIAAFIAVLGLIMKLALVPGGAAIFTVGVSSLMFVYMTFGFNIFNNYKFKPKGAKKIVFGIGLGLTFSSGLAGILFKVMIWPGYSINILIGLAGIILFLVLLLVDKNDYYRKLPNVMRFCSIGIALVLLYFIPINSIIYFSNRNCSGAAEALIKARETNSELDWDTYTKLKQECDLKSYMD